jgi:hypothetical protein
MWQRTYDRLVERVEALEAAALDTANIEFRNLKAVLFVELGYQWGRSLNGILLFAVDSSESGKPLI